MNKYLYFLVSLILLIIVVFWKINLSEIGGHFYDLSIWGIYLFSVPLTYSIIASFLGRIVRSPKTIALILLGVLVSILFSRDLSNSFWMQKLIVSFIGAIATWLLFVKLQF